MPSTLLDELFDAYGPKHSGASPIEQAKDAEGAIKYELSMTFKHGVVTYELLTPGGAAPAPVPHPNMVRPLSAGAPFLANLLTDLAMHDAAAHVQELAQGENLPGILGAINTEHATCTLELEAGKPSYQLNVRIKRRGEIPIKKKFPVPADKVAMAVAQGKLPLYGALGHRSDAMELLIENDGLLSALHLKLQLAAATPPGPTASPAPTPTPRRRTL